MMPYLCTKPLVCTWVSASHAQDIALCTCMAALQLEELNISWQARYAHLLLFSVVYGVPCVYAIY